MKCEGKETWRKAKSLQRLGRLRLIDDDFMRICFAEEKACAELLLRIVLGKRHLCLQKATVQKELNKPGSRSLRLDLYAEDKNGKCYNVEFQRKSAGADAKRARYHSSLMDAELAEPGAEWKDLKEIYVIFITENDVLGSGEAVYHVERTVAENGALFEDGAHVIYVNGAFRGDTPIGKLIHDFFCINPDDMYYSLLAERVRYFKQNEKGVAAMCQAFEETYEEGREEGASEERRRLILYLFHEKGLSAEEISGLTDLDFKDVDAFIKEV